MSTQPRFGVTVLGVLAILVLLLGGGAAHADFILPANADTYISSTNPTTNFGGSTTLLVGPLGGNSTGNFTLVRFDLSSLSGQPLVTQAIFSIWVTQVNTGGGVDVSQITSPWSESTVTFSTQPSVASPLATNVPFGSSGYVNFNITPVVQFWQNNPSSNNGVEISASLANPSTNGVFASRENSMVSEPPILTLTGVSSPVPEPASVTLALIGAGLAGLAGWRKRRMMMTGGRAA
jgi:hypothetical protein